MFGRRSSVTRTHGAKFEAISQNGTTIKAVQPVLVVPAVVVQLFLKFVSVVHRISTGSFGLLS